jgi:hypothetical protein
VALEQLRRLGEYTEYLALVVALASKEYLALAAMFAHYAQYLSVTNNAGPAGEGMIGARDNIGLPLRDIAAATALPQWRCPLVCKFLRWAADHGTRRKISLLDCCQVLLLLL